MALHMRSAMLPVRAVKSNYIFGIPDTDLPFTIKLLWGYDNG